MIGMFGMHATHSLPQSNKNNAWRNNIEMVEKVGGKAVEFVNVNES